MQFNLTAKSFYQFFLHLALIVLAIEVIILNSENHQLKKNSNPKAEQVKAGDLFSITTLEELENKNKPDTTSRQLIFVFTTTCPFCKLNMQQWREISSFADKNNVAVLGVSLDSKESTTKYLEENKLPFPVYIPKDSPQFKKVNKVFTVPQTIVLSSKSRVDKVWTGLLSDKTALEVKGYLASISNIKKGG